MNLTWKARTDPFMKWFTFTLFVIWLIVDSQTTAGCGPYALTTTIN